MWEKSEQECIYLVLVLMLLADQEFELCASADEGGAISPDGNTEVKYGKDFTYTITPDEGYEIADVLVDGKSVGAVSEYTFLRVKQDHTITASFKRINP